MAAAEPSAGATRDLSDAEIAELDELLSRTPEPLVPLDVSMLDGYLCGVLVQPVLLNPEQWLPAIFDAGGGALSEAVDAAWLARVRELAIRHHAALNRSLVDLGGFEPLIFEYDAPPSGDEEAVAAFAAASAVSRAITPWAFGFELALTKFPALDELDDPDVGDAIDAILRHLPAEDGEERRRQIRLDAVRPLATLDAAIEDLVDNVAWLFDRTEGERYRVATFRRETPKPGRNQPCPCGSGRKFKQCHGA